MGQFIMYFAAPCIFIVLFFGKPGRIIGGLGLWVIVETVLAAIGVATGLVAAFFFERGDYFRQMHFPKPATNVFVDSWAIGSSPLGEVFKVPFYVVYDFFNYAWIINTQYGCTSLYLVEGLAGVTMLTTTIAIFKSMRYV